MHFVPEQSDSVFYKTQARICAMSPLLHGAVLGKGRGIVALDALQSSCAPLEKRPVRKGVWCTLGFQL